MVSAHRWFEEQARLTTDVEKLFRQVSNRLAVPTHSACTGVAFNLMVLRHGKRYERPTKLIKYGKLFLHHLEPECREIQDFVDMVAHGWRPVREEWFQEQPELRDIIDQTRRDIERLLPVAKWPHHPCQSHGI